tara:strand:- start:3 stop:425 length:423 start_codon:yes stop_codon:yes gene_type:complete
MLRKIFKSRTIINTKIAPQPLGLYSQAVKSNKNELIFISGQVGVDINGKLVGENDVYQQTIQTFKNIELIINSQGADLRDILEFTTYLVGKNSIKPFLDARKEVFVNHFSNNDYPANTLLVVESLVSDEFLVEIKAVGIL